MLRIRAVAMLSVASIVAALFGSRLPHGHASIPRAILSIRARCPASILAAVMRPSSSGSVCPRAMAEECLAGRLAVKLSPAQQPYLGALRPTRWPSAR